MRPAKGRNEFESIEEAHFYLMMAAADEANQAIHRKDQTGTLQGEIWRPDPLRSESGGLCMSLDEGLAQTLSPQQIQHFHEEGYKAIRKVLSTHKEILVGLILAEARRGRNYFDRFFTAEQGKRGEQGVLF